MDISSLLSSLNSPPGTSLAPSAATASTTLANNTATENSGSFASAVQTLAKYGELSTNNLSMLQALSNMNTNGNSVNSAEMLQTLQTMSVQTSDLSMLQALGTGSNAGVAGLLQSMQNIAAQSNDMTLAQALTNAANPSGTATSQDDILMSLLRPASGSSDAVDPFATPQPAVSSATDLGSIL